MKVLLPFAALLLLCSCIIGLPRGGGRAGGRPGGAPPSAPGVNAAVGDAALNLAVGVGAAAVSRAGGGCYASCPTGTTCNPKTGLCDTLPCHGRCGPNERCDTSSAFERCVRDAPDLWIQGSGLEPQKVRLTPP